jgi:hypothetical protein
MKLQAYVKSTCCFPSFIPNVGIFASYGDIHTDILYDNNLIVVNAKGSSPPLQACIMM